MQCPPPPPPHNSVTLRGRDGPLTNQSAPSDLVCPAEGRGCFSQWPTSPYIAFSCIAMCCDDSGWPHMAFEVQDVSLDRERLSSLCATSLWGCRSSVADSKPRYSNRIHAPVPAHSGVTTPTMTYTMVLWSPPLTQPMQHPVALIGANGPDAHTHTHQTGCKGWQQGHRERCHATFDRRASS